MQEGEPRRPPTTQKTRGQQAAGGRPCSVSTGARRQSHTTEEHETVSGGGCSATGRRTGPGARQLRNTWGTSPGSPCLHRQGLRGRLRALLAAAAAHVSPPTTGTPDRNRNTGCKHPCTLPSATRGTLQEVRGARMCEDRELPAASAATLAARTGGSTDQQDAACGHLPDQAH